MMTLLQQVIGGVADNIQVVLQIDKSTHAGERQARHSGMYISDETITNALSDAVQIIASNLLLDNIHHKQRLLIVNHKYTPPLNIVGVIQKNGNKLKFVVITIMHSNQFKTRDMKILQVK